MNIDTDAKSGQEQIEVELSKAFHLMYDGFPEPVQLTHRTHRVVAVNPAMEKYGRTPGMNCARGCPGLKAGFCRHVQMMKKAKAAWLFGASAADKQPLPTYWIPVSGHPEYYIHYGIGVAIDYAAHPTED